MSRVRAIRWLNWLASEDRGVSTILGYALNLSIATLLMTTLLITGADVVETQREQAVRSELQVLGQQLASAVVTADQLNASGTESATVTDVVVRRTLPTQVVDTSYTIDVTSQDGDDEYGIVLDSANPDVTITVRFVSAAEVRTEDNSPLGGGPVVINHTDTDGDSVPELEVGNG
ncbi:hypothetical protein BRC86_07335 [Halobacteriales archaeon QS_3_64_16]|nr:MAG: hypothetical protein BRC86_07335 [Halobacteriales archaeon QS_3_64_16]